MNSQMKKRVIPTVTAFFALIIAIGGAMAAYDIVRPWATQQEYLSNMKEIERVAAMTCEGKLRVLNAELLAIESSVEQARAEGNANWLRSLLKLRESSIQEIARVKRECGWG